MPMLVLWRGQSSELRQAGEREGGSTLSERLREDDGLGVDDRGPRLIEHMILSCTTFATTEATPPLAVHLVGCGGAFPTHSLALDEGV